jgi:hypothetical protein
VVMDLENSKILIELASRFYTLHGIYNLLYLQGKISNLCIQFYYNVRTKSNRYCMA